MTADTRMVIITRDGSKYKLEIDDDKCLASRLGGEYELYLSINGMIVAMADKIKELEQKAEADAKLIKTLVAQRNAAWCKSESTVITPIQMVLYCPNCGHQHLDQPNHAIGWLNPPHKSHLCEFCKFVWRPADIETTGVIKTQTMGKDDSGIPLYHRGNK